MNVESIDRVCSMEFDQSQPIWMQIYEWICNCIASAEWGADARIPSVRELGARLAVNPNTVMRAYERLTDDGLVFNRRGIGYFVAEGAQPKAAATLRRRFEQEQLPRIFRSMRRVGLTPEEFGILYRKYLEEDENKQ